MKRWTALIFLAAYALSACTLTMIEPEPIIARDDITPVNDRINDLPSATPTLRPTNTPAPTSTPQRTNVVAQPVVLPNCTPRRDWPLYTVAAGDRLSSIARDVGSTVNELATANCLSDPNRITTGQQLRVPRVPNPIPANAGYVVISPYTYLDASGYTLQPNVTVTLSWPEARRDATRVDFFFTPTGGVTNVIGSDFNVADGAAMSWSVGQGSQGTLTATAFIGGSASQSTIGPARFVAGSTGSVGHIEFSPNLGFDGIRYTVREGDTITVFWRNAPTLQVRSVDFMLAASASPTAPWRRIGTDTYPADGVSVSTLANADFNGIVFAVASLVNNTTMRSADAQVTTQRRPPENRIEGQIVVAPFFEYAREVYTLEANAPVTLSWAEAPTREISQVEFILIRAGEQISLGIDSNLGDGAAMRWVVPLNLNGQVYAAARVNASSATVESRRINVASAVVAPPGGGSVGVSPIIRNDGGWMVLQIGATVTLSWPEAPTQATSVDFYVWPSGTGSTPVYIGTDNNLGDGASVIWIVPPSLMGHLSATAILPDGRNAETGTQTQVVGE